MTTNQTPPTRRIGNGLLSHDRAPTHRKGPWPRADQVAARLAAGETHAAIAASVGRTAASLRSRLSLNGFDPATALPMPARPAPTAAYEPTMADQPWAAAALCAQTDPEVFFPEKGSGAGDAKAVCLSCAVRDECLTWALESDQRFGVWGGLTDHQRAKMRREGRAS